VIVRSSVTTLVIGRSSITTLVIGRSIDFYKSAKAFLIQFAMVLVYFMNWSIELCVSGVPSVDWYICVFV